MKKYLFIVLFLSITFSNERIKFSVSSLNQKINDVNFEFITDRNEVIKMHIDQVSSKGQNLGFEINNFTYVDYLKWITGLSSAEMRGFEAIIKFPSENLDITSKIDRTYFEIKNIDLVIDEKENNSINLNSFDINYQLSNLEFSVPYFDDSEVDEFINAIVPDGKIPKIQFSMNYDKLNKTINIDGGFRMLSGSGKISISIIVNENDIDLTYIENSSIKLNNLADGLIDYINDIESKTNFSITKLGRGSFNIEYKGLFNNILLKDIEENVDKSSYSVGLPIPGFNMVFINSDPQNAQELIDLAVYNLDQYNENKAIENLNSLLEKYPDDSLASLAQYKLVNIYKNWKHDPEMVYNTLKKTVDNYPFSLQAKQASKELDSFQEWIINKAETLRKRKLTNESINNLLYLVKKYPNHELASKGQYIIGDIYMNDLRDFEKALDEYRIVLSNYEGSKEEALAQFMIGYIYANVLKDFDKARSEYQVFLDRFPKHELFPSVRFEIEYLGKDINEIPVLKHITS